MMTPNRLRQFLLLCAATGLFVCLATTVIRAQNENETPPPPSPAAAPVSTKSLLDTYREGGWIMHVLLACSVGSIAVVVYCFTQITPGKMAPTQVIDNMTRMMQRRDVTNAWELCQSQPCSFTNVLGSALVKVNFERDLANKLSMEQAAADSLDQEETRQMLWVNYLNVFATIAPMIGLLGTVVGMIEAFDLLAQKKSEPEDLAGGIGKAMSTTAGGLLVGIPSMFFYFFFRNRLMAIIASIQKNATFMIDILSGEVKLAGAETTETEG